MPNFELREGRINKGHPGILVIDEKYEMLYNKSNKEQNIFFYYCKYRRTKGILCQAKATISKLEINGEIKHHLKTWSLEHSHPACQAEVAAEGMKLEMCEIVKSNPDEPVSSAREKVILKYVEKYREQPGMWHEILEYLGDFTAVDKRLYRAREKIVGKAPKNRNEFEPKGFFEDGSEVIVLDSNDLPEGWRNDIRAKIVENESSREWGNINDTIREYEKTMDQFEESEVDLIAGVDDEYIAEGQALPKRVLAFSSKQLLELFETNLCGRSSLDGTFKSIPVLWKQLFIWMIKYNGCLVLAS